MSDTRNFMALDWVKSEIDATLKRAMESLEAYAETPDDSTAARQCLSALHQVHGTLQMVELSGAAELASEMEAVAQALMNGTVTENSLAQEALMEGILQLPAHLNRVQRGAADDASVHRPLMNRMRQARGEEPLAGGAGAALSTAADPATVKMFLDGNGPATVRKLRGNFQKAMLALIKRAQPEQKLWPLFDRIFSTLEDITPASPVARLWWLSAGVMERLNQTGGSAGPVVPLLREIDPLLKGLAEQPEEALAQSPPQSLIDLLLDQISAPRADDSDRLQAIRRTLGGADDEAPPLPSVGADEETIATVAAVIHDELADVKDRLDLLVRGTGRDAESMSSLADDLQRISGTLAVVGLGDLRDMLGRNSSELRALAGSDDISDDAIMEIASSVLFADNTLMGLAGLDADDGEAMPGSLSDAQEAVLREARASLEKVKQAVVDFIAAEWDHDRLADVPSTLTTVRSVLGMVPLDHAAGLVESCRAYVANELLAEKAVPEWQQLDTLADALTSIDYFLERMLEDGSIPSASLLDVADESVQALGYALGTTTDAAPEAVAESELEPDLEAEAEPEPEPEPEIELELEAELEADAEPEIELDLEAEAEPEAEPASASAEDEPSSLSEPTETDFELDEELELPAEAEAEAEAEPEPEPEPEPEVEAAAEAGDEEEEALVDDEIIEIFVEECGEVLENIDASFPAWRKNPTDTEALTEVRRAFHTLKGSGRMVGASVIGELAWSIENMLNRVLDGTIEVTPAVMDIVAEVRELVPGLREAFAEHRDAGVDVQVYMDRADVLASGGSSEELPEQPQAASASVDDEPSSLTAPVEEDFELDDDLELEEEPEEVELEAPPVPEVEEPAEPEVGATAADEEPDEDELDRPSSIRPPVEDDFALDDFEPAPEPEPEPEPSEDGLLEIFAEEARTHLATVKDYLGAALEDPAAVPLSDDLRRALHTLKGSAAMASLPGMSALAAPLEHAVRGYLELKRSADAQLVKLLDEGRERIEKAFEQVVQAGTEGVAGDDEAGYLERAGALVAELAAEVERRGSGGGGATTVEIFKSEHIDALIDAGELIDAWGRGEADAAALETVRDELAALTRRAAAAGEEGIAELAQALASAHAVAPPAPGADAVAVFATGHDALIGQLDALAAGLEVPSADAAVRSVRELAAGFGQAPRPVSAEEAFMAESAPVSEPVSDAEESLDLDPEMVEIFFEETDELIETIEASASAWPEGDESAPDALMRALHTLKGGARMAGLRGLGEQAHQLETWIGEHRAGADEATFGELSDRVGALADRIEGLKSGEIPATAAAAPAVEEAPAAAAPPTPEPEAPEPPEPAPEVAAEEVVPAPPPEPVVEEEEDEVVPLPEVINEPGTSKKPAPAPTAGAAMPADDLAEVDDDILALFLEEAVELTEAIDAALGSWIDQRDNEVHLEALLRALHTMKGGARMAGLSALGEFVHDLETKLIDLRGKPESTTDAFFADVQSAADAISARVTALSTGEPEPEAAAAPPAPAPEPEPAAEAAPAEEPEPVATAPAPEPAPQPTPAPAPEVAATPAAPAAPTREPPAESRETASEQIRVSSSLLDNLVNLAGETSIMRGRIEQEVTDFGSALDEMEATVERIRDQIRTLEIEAQAQVQYRQEQAAKEGYEDFDPLEMDRYTQLQELARTLSESASDMNDLRDTLLDRIRDTETLLLQQGRINTELQEGLMRTRMVPFARLLPRLKRIVRQVGRELGKPVELEVQDAEGELDRNILERMIPPLEHMLRNAVDHGIEAPEVRAERGKPPQGRITLRLARQGGDILVEVSDDGGGINAEGVRKKAIERGLLAADAQPTEGEVLAFIMSAGFSTAQSVTQISGRGVGMDVVASEVKQLGGSISIASTLGEGSRFTIRLPFTVSVNRALMVSVDDDVYAVPLNSIVGIVRVSPRQLMRQYEAEHPGFNYAGRSYDLAYLGSYLGRPHKVRDDVPSVPVIMVTAGEQTKAVHVDAVLGSREIVVKSLGPQFAGFAGVSGATILGDGSVVIILDLAALLMRGSGAAAELTLSAGAAAPVVDEEDERPPRVMVVDDSVTVRKVTSRLLERKGMEVILAKDGLEAVNLLQEQKPDVMLLDIEMPRMDGFEVARHVKNDAQLADIPIIMITSRTGEKHRERATAIGVNRFMGKPFQEKELLENIAELTRG